VNKKLSKTKVIYLAQTSHSLQAEHELHAAHAKSKDITSEDMLETI